MRGRMSHFFQTSQSLLSDQKGTRNNFLNRKTAHGYLIRKIVKPNHELLCRILKGRRRLVRSLTNLSPFQAGEEIKVCLDGKKDAKLRLKTPSVQADCC